MAPYWENLNGTRSQVIETSVSVNVNGDLKKPLRSSVVR